MPCQRGDGGNVKESSNASAHPVLRTGKEQSELPAGRWRKVQGKFRIRAHTREASLLSVVAPRRSRSATSQIHAAAAADGGCPEPPPKSHWHHCSTKTCKKPQMQTVDVAFVEICDTTIANEDATALREKQSKVSIRRGDGRNVREGSKCKHIPIWPRYC